MADPLVELHVVRRGPQWAIVRPGQRVPLSSYARRSDAIGVAEVIAKHESLTLVVLDLAGKTIPREEWDAE